MRGEYLPESSLIPACQGSPPHARGILERFFRKGSRIGITPACAGNTRSYHSCIPTRRDHPRMRGEYGYSGFLWYESQGSPPHARGILRKHNWNISLRGITPACAGNTPLWCRHLFRYWDHPRMRGEYSNYLKSFGSLPGSPPHARGIRSERRGEQDSLRITPACAGNTLGLYP